MSFAAVLVLAVLLLCGCDRIHVTANSEAPSAPVAPQETIVDDIALSQISARSDATATVNPFEQNTASVVLIFARHDCPVSNRYAPEVGRIVRRFQEDGVRFWIVYPDPSMEAESIRRHLREYDYPCSALWDPDHRLTSMTGATITPEAVVCNASRKIVYRGRIDDRYVDFGKARPEPQQRDLVTVLEGIVAGTDVSVPFTEAIGCPIADLKK